MSNGRRHYARMRSLLEVPILNEKFWSKVPGAPADAIMIDFEDSATPDNKVAVREKALQALENMEYFGGRHVVVRVNNLSTPWGRDDLVALNTTKANILVCYPKVQTADELVEVRQLLQSGARRDLYPMIETARAMIELDTIARVDGWSGCISAMSIIRPMSARAPSTTRVTTFTPRPTTMRARKLLLRRRHTACLPPAER
jgi:citrate lyase beta subunit